MDNKTGFQLFTLSLLLLSSTVLAEPEPEITSPNTTDPKQSEQTNQQTPADETETENNAVIERAIEELDPYKQFITEKLYVFMHSGGTTDYRIIGRIAAGDEVTVLSRDVESGWLKVRASNGSEGWVNNDSIVANAGLKVQLDNATSELQKVRAELQSIKSNSGADTELMTQQISELTAQNQKLTSQLETTVAENAELRASIQQIDETKRILGKLYDFGGVLLGVFVGWLLTRRKKNQWV